MTALTRRAALVGAGAAMAVAGGPGAVKASQTDPVAVLAAKAAVYEEWLNSLHNVSDDEFNALAGVHFEMEHRILDTPATSFEGITGKLRIAWNSAETDELYPLASERFIWSALQDLERLAGGRPS